MRRLTPLNILSLLAAVAVAEQTPGILAVKAAAVRAVIVLLFLVKVLGVEHLLRLR